MANRITQLGRSLKLKPDPTAERIITLFRTHYSCVQVAKRIGVHRVTVNRWINVLGIRDAVDDIQEEWRKRMY
jgi:transposase-like protein